MGKRHEKLSGWKKCSLCGRPLKAKFDNDARHTTCYRCHQVPGQAARVKDVFCTFDAKARRFNVYMQLGKKRYLSTFEFDKPVKQLRPTQVGQVIATQLEQALTLMREDKAMQVRDKPKLILGGFEPA
jgi:hypothetical protein